MKSRFRIFSIIFFLSLICLTPMLSGCFSTCGKLFGFSATDFIVYINGEELSSDNNRLVFEYGKVEDIKSLITIKEVNIRDDIKDATEDFRIEMNVPLNSETLPGLYGVDVYYKDLEHKTVFVNITGLATEITLNLQYEYQYGSYDLPVVNEHLDRPYTLYYSTDHYGRNEVEWTSNTQLAPGHYYAWAEMESTQIYGPGNTYPRGFTIVKKVVDTPEPNAEFVYTGEEFTPSLESEDAKFISVISEKQMIPGTYTAKLRLHEYATWSDGTTEDKTFDWKIKKAKVALPRVVSSHTYDGSTQTVVLSDYDESLINLSGTLSAINAGKYYAKFTLKSSLCYEWETGSSSTTSVEWIIKKADLTPIEFSQTIIIKKASPLSTIAAFLDEDFTLYSSEKLPNGVIINDNEWSEVSTQTETIYTIKTYKTTAQKGIYWLKSVKTSEYYPTSTTYYQGGILDGEVNNAQQIYLGYTSDKVNYHPAPVLANITIEDKTLHTISLDEQSISQDFALNEQTNRYEIVYNRSQNSFIDAKSTTQDYVIVYKNISKTNEITAAAKDVGIYEVWAEITESEDNYFVSTEKYLIEVLAGEIDSLSDIIASDITFSQKLSDSTITANANYYGEIEGTFTWASPDTMPQVSDSNKTIYSFTFTPNDTNILPFTGETTLTINKAQITSHVEPTLNNNEVLYADALVSDVIIGKQGEAYFNDLLLEGKWSIEASGKRLQNTFNLIFTPSDENYNALTIAKNSSNTSNLVNVTNVSLLAEPTYSVIYKDGDTFRFWQDGTATFRVNYSSSIFKDYPIAKIDDFIVSSSTEYRLEYCGITSKSYSSNTATAINDIDGLEKALANTTGTYYLLNSDIKLTKTLTATTNKVIIVPNGTTLDFDEFNIDFTNLNAANCIFNCGTLLNNSTTTPAVSNLKEIVNYGEISLTYLSSSWMTINNYCNITFLASNKSVNGAINNLLPASNLVIEKRDTVSISGNNYGTVTCEANTTHINYFTNHAGATFTAGRTSLNGGVNVKANSVFTADVYSNTYLTEYEVTSLEKFIDAAKILSIAPQNTKIIICEDIDLTDCEIIVDGTETTSSTSLPLYSGNEITILSGVTLNLGGKNLVLHYTESEDENRVNGDGTITNGKISYNHEAVGSVYTEANAVTCQLQEITFENLNKNYTTAITQVDFLNKVNRYNGLDVNIIVDCDILLTTDLTINAPLKITIPEGRVFDVDSRTYLTLNYNKQGQFPQFFIYGTFDRPNTKVIFTQYDADYTANGFSSSNSFKLLDSGSFILNPNSYYSHYLIKDVSDLTTFVTLAQATTPTIINMKDIVTLTSDITLSKYCWIQFDLKTKSGGNLMYGINLNGYDLSLTYGDENNYTRIDNVEKIYSTVDTSDIHYYQNIDRLVKIYNSTNKTLKCDAFAINKLSSTFNSANLTLDVKNYEQLKVALYYSSVNISCFHFVNINIRNNITLTENLSLSVSAKHKVYLTLFNSTIFDLGGYTLALPNLNRPSYSGGEIYTKISLNSNAELKNGNVKIPKSNATSQNVNTFVTRGTGATLTNITYVYF